MSEQVDWQKLSPEERNHLVHERVMGLTLLQMCNGSIGEQSNSSDGWYCMKCGYEGWWGDDYEHEQIAPHYSESIMAAWEVVEKMVARMGYNNLGFSWRGPLFKPEHHYLTREGYPLGTTCWYIDLTADDYNRFVCAKTPQEAICKAALIVSGVKIV